MDITVNCAKCGQHIAISEALVGHQVQCPTCGQRFTVPVIGTAPKPASPLASTPLPPATSDTKKCPYCAETIKAEAILCRFCNRDFLTSQSSRPAQTVPAKTIAKPLSPEQRLKNQRTDPWDDADYFSGSRTPAQPVRRRKRRRTWPVWIGCGFIAICLFFVLFVLPTLWDTNVIPHTITTPASKPSAGADVPLTPEPTNVTVTLTANPSNDDWVTVSGTEPVFPSQQNSAVVTAPVAELPKHNAPAITIAQLAIDPSEWPKEVTLTKKAFFPIIIGGQENGAAKMPAGTKLKLVEVRSDGFVKLAYGPTTQLVPAQDTDLIDRVQAARDVAAREKVRRDEIAQREKDRIIKVVTECPAPVGFTRKPEPDNTAAQSTCNNAFYSVDDYIKHRAQLYGKRVTVQGEVMQCGIGMHSEGDWYILEGKLDCRFRLGSHCTEGSSKECSGHRIVSITGTAYEGLAHLGIPKLVDCNCPDGGW